MNKRKMINDYKEKLALQLDKKLSVLISRLFTNITSIKKVNVGMGDYVFYEIEVNNKNIIVGIDEYNNIFYYRHRVLTIEEINSVREILIYYLENENSYTYRSGTSFLINYYKVAKPNKKFIKEMIKIDNPKEEDNEGLEDWLISYEGWEK